MTPTVCTFALTALPKPFTGASGKTKENRWPYGSLQPESTKKPGPLPAPPCCRGTFAKVSAAAKVLY